ncbi:DUF732 domain-containing protein [Mycobacterium sp. 050134]|uniref:DUF732 domain-containing protein n=1 Tax=Mycobacterium sp. 050134 TaxID=3096111 RepID=UPI002EDA9447
MSHSIVRRGKWCAACAVLVSTAATLLAAPAAADPMDDAFIDALAKQGIPISDRDSAIGMAHSVCGALDRGETSSFLAMKVRRDANLSPRQAGFFMGVSVAAYCPQYKGTIDPSVIWLLPPLPVTQ